MTLSQIRTATSLGDLLPAVKFLCHNMQAMSFGEFQAYKRTLENQTLVVGSDLATLNNLALEFQTDGVISHE